MEEHTSILATATDMEREARSLVSRLALGEKATLITLSGELGAGKTTFTQSLAKALGITDTVNSPTFVIQKTYPITNDTFSRLVHMDAYRLKDSSELDVLGFDEVLSDPKTLIVLEWPERVPEVAKDATIHITLEPLDDGSRRIIYA